jgi:hypothetical protein
MDTSRLLQLCAYLLAGWFALRFFPIVCRTVAVLLPLAATLLVVSLAATGLLASVDQVHRWTGHGYFILMWLAIPFSIEFLIYNKIRVTPVAALFQSFILLLCLPVAFVAGVTGYLGPGHNPDVIGETYRRFLVLHCVGLPAVIIIFHGLCCTLFGLLGGNRIYKAIGLPMRSKPKSISHEHSCSYGPIRDVKHRREYFSVGSIAGRAVLPAVPFNGCNRGYARRDAC